MALLFWTDFFYTKLTERYYEEHKLLYLYPFDVKEQ